MFSAVLLLIVSLTCQTDMVTSTLVVTTQEECNDIIHVWQDGRCLSVCNNSLCQDFYPLRYDCSEYLTSGFVITIFGYWYDNNISHCTLNCPEEYCDLSEEWNSRSHPDRNEQCVPNWGGIVCGECKGNNSIIFDTTECVQSSNRNNYGNLWHGWPWLLVFLTTLLYWCIFILLLVVVLKFKFDTSIGYVYGLLFYYSVLENVVKQHAVVTTDYSQVSPQCESYDDGYYTAPIESLILSSLGSIGNLKPAFLQLMKLCLNTQVIDHIFFVYTHPLIVMSILATIAVAAKKSSKLTELVRRHSNSLICLILLLSYSSISYTSVQLLKPLAVYNRITGKTKWHLYLSPSIPFAHKWRVLYVIFAVFCEVIVSIGLPFLLLFKRSLASKFNLNLTRIKPILDQLQGCYKDEYRWFAAYYLLCRQLII